MRYLTSQKYLAPLKTLLHSRSRSSPSAILFDESSSAATWSSFRCCFNSKLTDEDWSLSPSARHIPATVRSLKMKTFVILHSPNEVLLSSEILLHHDQIFSFLSTSLKSILDHYKGARKICKAWTRTLRNVPKVACTVQNKTRGIVGTPVEGKERLEWWKTTSWKRNTEAKTTALGRHFLFTQISMRW